MARRYRRRKLKMTKAAIAARRRYRARKRRHKSRPRRRRVYARFVATRRGRRGRLAAGRAHNAYVRRVEALRRARRVWKKPVMAGGFNLDRPPRRRQKPRRYGQQAPAAVTRRGPNRITVERRSRLAEAERQVMAAISQAEKSGRIKHHPFGHAFLWGYVDVAGKKYKHLFGGVNADDLGLVCKIANSIPGVSGCYYNMD